MCDTILECGKQGMGKAEQAAEIGVHHSTFIAWQEEHPEFSAAVKDAQFFSQAWWEGKGRVATFDSVGFNATSFIFNMKNRFPDDWRDKHEEDNKHDMSDPVKEFFAQVANAGKRIGE